MPKSNAQRQAEYRARKKGRNAPVTPAIADAQVTADERAGRDYWKDGEQYVYLGNWGYGPIYAKVVNSRKSEN